MSRIAKNPVKDCVSLVPFPARHSPVHVTNVWALQPYLLEFTVNGVPVQLGRHRDPGVYLLSVADSIASNGMADFLCSPSIALKADPAVLQTIWRTASLCHGSAAVPSDLEAFEVAVRQLRWDSDLGAHMETLREWGGRLTEYHSALYRVEAAPERIRSLKNLARSGRTHLVDIRFVLDDGKEVCHYSEFVREVPSRRELRFFYPEGVPLHRVRVNVKPIAVFIAEIERELAEDRELVARWDTSPESIRPAFPGEVPLETPEF